MTGARFLQRCPAPCRPATGRRAWPRPSDMPVGRGRPARRRRARPDDPARRAVDVDARRTSRPGRASGSRGRACRRLSAAPRLLHRVVRLDLPELAEEHGTPRAVADEVDRHGHGAGGLAAVAGRRRGRVGVASVGAGDEVSLAPGSDGRCSSGRRCRSRRAQSPQRWPQRPGGAIESVGKSWHPSFSGRGRGWWTYSDDDGPRVGTSAPEPSAPPDGSSVIATNV